MGNCDDPIDLGSDEDDCMSLGSEDDAQQDVGESWICRHCTLCNPPYAGDCSRCGLPNRAAADAGTTGDDVVDLTAPQPALDVQTRSYVKSTVNLEDAVALDVCGCRVNRQTLKAHIQRQAAHMPSDIAELDRHFCCVNGGCGKPLARRDIVSMVDAQATRKMDEHTHRMFQAQAQAAASQKSGRSRAKKSRLTPEPDSLRQAISLTAAIAALQTALGVPQASPNGASREANGAATASTTRSAAASAAAATEAKVQASQQKPADKKAPKKAGHVNGIAKGTGYGGDKGYFGAGHVKLAGAQNAAQQATMQRARDREAAADKATLDALQEVKACIDGAAGRTSGNLLQSPAMAVCGIAFGGPLAFLLRSLLQNDSLMDIGRRSALYWMVVRLVQSLGRCVDFIPLFLKPAGPEEGGSSSESHTEPAGSMLDALRTLDIQCRVFKRNAEDLASEDDMIEPLALALEINNSYEELQNAADVLNAAQQRLQASIAGASSLRGLQPEEDQASIERRYCAAVGKYRLCQWPLVQLRDFYFRSQAEKAGAFSAKKSMLRIGQEMSSLATSLPIAWASSVFLVADDNRMDIIRALIVGPENTPYENGIYLFDILLPPEYPEEPPKVQFLTTGSGTVRFNPNLYNCGKVCLSLLGTWSGPAWEPATSTLLQVLVSIQSMIFIEDPYFNEPGHEATAGSSQGQAQSTAYNRNICAQNLRHALLPAVLKPPPAFKELLKVHFKFKHDAILKQLETWQATDPGLKASCDQIRSALDQYRTKEGLPIGT